MATMAVTTFASPINMVKVRVQSNPLPLPVSGAVRQLWKENGVRAFYAALPISISMSIPSGIVYLLSYETCRDYLAASVLSSSQLGYAPLLAGFGSKVLCSTLFCPLEVLTVRVQSSSKPSILGTVGKIWRHDGVVGFYRGLGVTLLRDAPFSAFYWALLTDFKRRIQLQYPAWSESNGFATTFMAAGSACFGAALATQPMDLIKTRLQAAPDRMSGLQLLKALYRCGGVIGLYQGLGLRTMQMVPASALFMATFDTGRRMLHRHFELQ
jgi:solute carrier family 25 protein 39/40